MNKEFIPEELEKELRGLGYESNTYILWQQAFRFFREKFKFTYSIGNTNIAVLHYGLITQLLQDNATYQDAELATIKWFIDVAKQLNK
jgi:hypothetical protein